LKFKELFLQMMIADNTLEYPITSANGLTTTTEALPRVLAQRPKSLLQLTIGKMK
jgi:hypothetical protein